MLMPRDVICHGWPEKQVIPEQRIPYYSYRGELAVQNGLIFKRERLVIPWNLKLDMNKSVVTATFIVIMK